jgi:hypothetical protein
VIAQWPNWPLWLAILLYGLQFLPWTAFAQISFWGVFFVMLYWAYLEIRFGVNGWRRTLGVLVMIYLLYSRLF